MSKNSAVISLVFVLCILVLAGCTAGPNSAVHTASTDGNIAGFWRGLWHGIIAPITFIISLFIKSVSFYEVHNNGGWYNLGFVLGAGMLCGGCSKSSKKNK